MASLKRVRFLHCADLHLDAPFTSLADSSAAGSRRHELRLALSKIISLVKSEKADLLLVAGDLFEHGYVGKSTIQLLKNEFESIKNTHVVIIPGNHDPFTADSYYRSSGWPANVHILESSAARLDLEPEGVSIYCGIPGEVPDGERINILMLHGTVGMNPDGKAYNPYAEKELEVFKADYIALGHFHNRIQGAGSRGRIFNPGSPEPLGFDEEGSHGVFVGAIDKSEGVSNLDVGFVPINHRSYINLAVKLHECASDEQAADKAARALAEGRAEDLYSITFTGTMVEGFRLDRKRVTGYLNDKAFFVKIKDETVPSYDAAGIANEPGLRGLFAAKMLAKASEAMGDGEREIVMQALYYGLEAIDRGEINI